MVNRPPSPEWDDDLDAVIVQEVNPPDNVPPLDLSQAQAQPSRPAETRPSNVVDAQGVPILQVQPIDSLVADYYARISSLRATVIRVVHVVWVPLYITQLIRRVYCQMCIRSLCIHYRRFRFVDYLQGSTEQSNSYRTSFHCYLCHASLYSLTEYIL